MSQLSLALPPLPDPDADSFVLSGCNERAARLVDSWPNWPGPTLAVSGPEGAGKSLLAARWAARVGAAILDGRVIDLDQAMERAYAGRPIQLDHPEGVAESSLLHLLNAAAERKGGLLLVHREPPAQWPARLADLRSRLAALPVAALERPDDALLRALLVKKFSARQVRVNAELLDFLLSRCERSAASIEALVVRLDGAALAAGKPITLPLARAVLAEPTDS